MTEKEYSKVLDTLSKLSNEVKDLKPPTNYDTSHEIAYLKALQQVLLLIIKADVEAYEQVEK